MSQIFTSIRNASKNIVSVFSIEKAVTKKDVSNLNKKIDYK